MIYSYLLSALRNFTKNKFHTSFTVIGLAIGLMSCLLAIIFVLDEQSFDQFHSKKDRIYRLNKVNIDSEGIETLNAESSGLFGPGIKDEFPEVESVVRYQPWFGPVVVSNNDRHIELQDMESIFVDSTFFTVFDFTLLRGDKKAVLARPSTVVLSESLATGLFGSEDPIGKTVVGLNGLEFEVTGIAAEAPRNSHIQFKALISWSTTVPQLGPLNFNWLNNWRTQSLTTYLLLRPQADPKNLEQKFPQFMQAHLPERVGKYELYLQPFTELYLHSFNLTAHRMARAGNIQYVYTFSIIAGFILFIACINYININTSRATRRAREVGMRKSLGASRAQLVNQFLGESFLLTCFSMLVGIAMLYLAIPYFNNLSGKLIPISLINNSTIILSMVFLLVGVSVLSGFYPALILSSYKPTEVLKASAKNKIAGNWLRYLLISFQFCISIAMLAGTLLIYKQMIFISDKNLGFDKEHVLVLNLTDDIMEKGDVFENTVRQHPDVVQVSRSRTAIGGGYATTTIVPEGFQPDQVEVRMFPVDMTFLSTYQLEMSTGRFFDPAIASDSGAYIINETLMQQLGWENPLQKTIRFDEESKALPIIGVVKDFHFKSLYEDIEPLLMWVQPENRRNLSIRFSGNPSSLLAFLETKWKSFESRYPFHYYFVDEAFNSAYQADRKLYATMITFAGLSIFIACMGLYGLVSYTLEQRTKEFGIRKVLGATVSHITMLVSRKFILMVFIAGVIVYPAMLPLMKNWLDKFAFHISPSPSVFIDAVLITLLVTLLAVSIQSFRAALLNPSKSLKHE